MFRPEISRFYWISFYLYYWYYELHYLAYRHHRHLLLRPPLSISPNRKTSSGGGRFINVTVTLDSHKPPQALPKAQRRIVTPVLLPYAAERGHPPEPNPEPLLPEGARGAESPLNQVVSTLILIFIAALTTCHDEPSSTWRVRGT